MAPAQVAQARAEAGIVPGTARRHAARAPSPSAQVFEAGPVPTTIGRAEDNVVVLDGDDYASGHHARVESGLDGTWVVDLGSTNGTYVNGERVEGRPRLHEGDLVQVGDTELRVRAMRLGESAGRTDPGRVRRRNEDSFVLDPPLFAVADGMGGAQAGEVASRLDGRRVPRVPRGRPPRRRTSGSRRSSRRRTGASTSGRGPTRASPGWGRRSRPRSSPAGGSRSATSATRAPTGSADGELEQLTDDHSLVGDLMRSGRLTPEEADAHPQRSVITRALGTDPRGRRRHASRSRPSPGDVFLLCSDGLTTMVADDDILGILAAAPSLDDAATGARARRQHAAAARTTSRSSLFRRGGRRARRGDARGAPPPSRATARATPTSSRTRSPTSSRCRRPRPAAAVGGTPRRPRKQRPRWGRAGGLGACVALALGRRSCSAARSSASRGPTSSAPTRRATSSSTRACPSTSATGVGLYRERYVSTPAGLAALARRSAPSLFDHELVSYERARARVAVYEAEAVP